MHDRCGPSNAHVSAVASALLQLKRNATTDFFTLRLPLLHRSDWRLLDVTFRALLLHCERMLLRCIVARSLRRDDVEYNGRQLDPLRTYRHPLLGVLHKCLMATKCGGGNAVYYAGWSCDKCTGGVPARDAVSPVLPTADTYFPNLYHLRMRAQTEDAIRNVFHPILRALELPLPSLASDFLRALMVGTAPALLQCSHTACCACRLRGSSFCSGSVRPSLS